MAPPNSPGEGIYIHIPFCLQKCSYCDFLSFECAGHDPAITQQMRFYTHALLAELEAAELPLHIGTIYIGGGTPTALPLHLLCKILSAINGLTFINASPFINQKPLTPPLEITVEANPGTLSTPYLQGMKDHGVTRLSLGLQTTTPHLLKEINRLHTVECFLENYHAARHVGFTNINIDLIFALPGQTLAHWQETLRTVIALAPEHISLYSLTPGEGTPLWDALDAGTITLPTEETDRHMYHMAINQLQEAGYIHYELSNFAKPGYHSRHNVNCWQRVPYYGFGLGAHSFDGEKRWHNTTHMATYLQGAHQPQGVDHLTPQDHLSEKMFLGLRLLQGIPRHHIPTIFTPQINELMAQGLLTQTQSNIHLTPQGLDLANQVFEAFL